MERAIFLAARVIQTDKLGETELLTVLQKLSVILTDSLKSPIVLQAKEEKTRISVLGNTIALLLRKLSDVKNREIQVEIINTISLLIRNAPNGEFIRMIFPGLSFGMLDVILDNNPSSVKSIYAGFQLWLNTPLFGLNLSPTGHAMKIWGIQ
ncbi:MAG: hypothetical protein EZS28_032584 [Streblomastix strix]|uniref:TTI1 N-terminal TPR domain-containing protein n=1 Tax=Streblomastix strix TaxID=222440 RepID=A0A5J4UN32_9EUKA|nr:MAG: hypothetical protein EZS28_032584 [Streblomastix strix]